ncbi:MAG: 8-amino-7-oxononanoate synthase, partial [Muribaculaceae bacterium]|nr:8-amino-7-oxononanoate synthase [Muribaculaceae bacterium]
MRHPAMQIENTLNELSLSGNLRSIPADTPHDVLDMSSNDYLGLGADRSLREEFFALYDPADLAMTSSASRLLAGSQQAYIS